MTEYEEYLVIDNKIKELTAQKEVLKTKILTAMVETGEKKKVTDVGTFTVSKLKTWTYSPLVTEMKDNLDAQKAKEESTGQATFVEKESLRFTGLSL